MNDRIPYLRSTCDGHIFRLPFLAQVFDKLKDRKTINQKRLQNETKTKSELTVLIVVELLNLSNRKAIYFDSQSYSLEKNLLHNLSWHTGEMHQKSELEMRLCKSFDVISGTRRSD